MRLFFIWRKMSKIYESGFSLFILKYIDLLFLSLVPVGFHTKIVVVTKFMETVLLISINFLGNMLIFTIIRAII